MKELLELDERKLLLDRVRDKVDLFHETDLMSLFELSACTKMGE